MTWFAVLWTVGMLTLGMVALRRILRAKRARDLAFIAGAADFARRNGGWPCRACIMGGAAGFCTHRTLYEAGPQG